MYGKAAGFPAEFDPFLLSAAGGGAGLEGFVIHGIDVDDFAGVHPNACILPHWTVDAVCIVPGGAHPSYTHGYYARDNAFYLAWDEIAASREGFRAWIDEHVMGGKPEDFARYSRAGAR